MKIKLYILLGFLFITTTVYSQNKKACDTKFHKQFDFWVGDWIVYDTVGNKVGENLIHKIEDDCIINEHWKSVRGGSGSSYNYFDSTDSTWNQLWIDNQGNNLILKGKASEGKMSMRSKLLKGQKIDFYYNRITWTLQEDGSVKQQWDILDKNDKLLSTSFIGIYRRR